VLAVHNFSISPIRPGNILHSIKHWCSGTESGLLINLIASESCSYCAVTVGILLSAAKQESGRSDLFCQWDCDILPLFPYALAMRCTQQINML
jgi:hypothetical protein